MIGSRLHRLAYILRRYHWQGATLQRWAGLLLLALAGAAALGWLPGRWLTAAALLLVWLLMLVWTWRSARRYHVHFTPEAQPAPEPERLAPEEKWRLAATGWFEVEGKGRAFTQLKAYFRTFATREHAVMAFVEATPILRLWRLPEPDIGMWYIFFAPEAIAGLDVGQLAFGSQTHPALRLRVQREGKEKPDEVYLSFEDGDTLRRVWADLLADGTVGQRESEQQWAQ